jgi:hypothetical protein
MLARQALFPLELLSQPWNWGLNLELYSCKAGTLLPEPYIESILTLVILEMRVSQMIHPGWPQTTILLISASQVARITSVSHWYPAYL